MPWDESFDARYLNYAPITVGLVILIVGVWWKVSAHKHFTGQTRNIDIDEALGEGHSIPGGDPPYERAALGPRSPVVTSSR